MGILIFWQFHPENMDGFFKASENQRVEPGVNSVKHR